MQLFRLRPWTNRAIINEGGAVFSVSALQKTGIVATMTASTVAQYLSALRADRRAALSIG
jgi:hypothetical protein